MPDFTNPFPGMRKEGDLDTKDIVRALRLDIAAEEDATHIYTAQADRITNPVVKNTLLSIADEERVHIGEFQRLIQHLNLSETNTLAEGAREVEQRERLEHIACVDILAEELMLHSVADGRRYQHA